MLISHIISHVLVNILLILFISNFAYSISGGKEMLCKIQQLNKGDIFVSFLLKTFSTYLLYDLNDAINFTPPPSPSQNHSQQRISGSFKSA